MVYPEMQGKDIEYPKMRMKTINDSILAYKKFWADRQPPQPPAARKPGESSPFQPSNPVGNVAKAAPPPRPKRADEAPSKEWIPQEYVLIRILDTNIEAGYTYKYQMGVQLQNPNWVGPEQKPGAAQPDSVIPYRPEMREMVTQAQMADEEFLYSNPITTPVQTPPPTEKNAIPTPEQLGGVSAPPEIFMYAVDPKKSAEPKKDPKSPKLLLTSSQDYRYVMDQPGFFSTGDGQAVLQFQRWLQYVEYEGGLSEPVGRWVVADVIVNRGMFIGGKQYVKLPLWSSELTRYDFREVISMKAGKSGVPKKMLGIEMDASKPGPEMLVVDVEGGKVACKNSSRRMVLDESAAEILILNEDGSMQVRSAALERGDRARMQREKTWLAWLDEVEKLTPKDSKDPNNMKKNAPGVFDK